MFAGKTLLITGGTGSFGNAAVERFLKTDIANIRIFSRDEKKQYDMRTLFKNPKLQFYLGDVRHYDSICDALRGVDYIFHAAALKQVPSCEFYPGEAVRTNVLGTENVLRAAIANRVKKIVCLSTDKAVAPINAMGLSKGLMEKILVAQSRNLDPDHTLICGTRYGNVMASRGSVIPVFIDQINSGLPISVTDPSMTRFLMSLDDALDLVLYAFKNAKQGDIFVKKAPACTVEQLARCLNQIFKNKSQIKIIGTRHGEKRHETLLSKEERSRAIETDEFFTIRADSRDLNYEVYFEKGDISLGELYDYSSDNTRQLNDIELKELLLSLTCVQENLKI